MLCGYLSYLGLTEIYRCKRRRLNKDHQSKHTCLLRRQRCCVNDPDECIQCNVLPRVDGSNSGALLVDSPVQTAGGHVFTAHSQIALFRTLKSSVRTHFSAPW